MCWKAAPARSAPADTGWLNRALDALEPEGRVNLGSRKVLAVGPVTPLVVRGPAPVMSWVPQRLPPASDDTTMRLLDLYSHTDPRWPARWKGASGSPPWRARATWMR